MNAAYELAMKGVLAGKFVLCLPYVDDEGDTAVDIICFTRLKPQPEADLSDPDEMVRVRRTLMAAMDIRQLEGYEEPPRTEEYPCA